MVAADYTTLSVLEIYRKFHVAPDDGLSESVVSRRREAYGKNTIQGKEERWMDILLRQFASPFIYLLLGAAILTALLRELVDSVLIVFFVGLNAGLGFYQEYHSHNTMKLLRRRVAGRARVIREGKEQIVHSELLVPGDIVILAPGDVIAADLRFTQCENVILDESVLTGESVHVEKSATALSEKAEHSYQAANIGFAATTVVSGKGVGVVVAIGAATVMGEASKLTIETRRISDFEKNLAKFSMFILWLILFTLLFIFIANIAIKGTAIDIPSLLVFSIALAVSVIPESLPVVTTFSLSRGALRLARQHVIVKRLSAIEDLGGIDILCTDKTGTLTQNQLTVDTIHSDNPPLLLRYAALAATEAYQQHDPNNAFDHAVWHRLSPTERKELRNWKRLWEIPFEPHRRRSTVVVVHQHVCQIIVRGAPEAVLPLCSTIKLPAIKRWIQQEGLSGKRVLAFAAKSIRPPKPGKAIRPQEEHDLTLLGCISFIDPLKPSATQAVEKARRLGVQVKILTGDSPDVAGHVAHAIGLIEDQRQVMTGDQWQNLPHHKQRETLHSCSVFARVSPQQKYALIRALEETHRVGFLGEGINDAPALKAANVAIVVDDASDIARDAADIILGKKSLMVIIDGVAEGRRVFANTMKYIKATISANFGNFYAVAISTFFISHLPMLPIQILLVNLLSDVPMIAVAGDTVDEQELLKPKTYDLKDIAFIASLLGIVSTVFDFICFALFYRMEPAILQTNWFITSILTELAFLYSVRTHLPFTMARRPAGILIGLTVLISVITLALPYTFFGQHTLMFQPPSVDHLLIIGAIIAIYFTVSEIVKLVYYRLVSAKE